MSEFDLEGVGQAFRRSQVGPDVVAWLTTELRTRRMSQRMLAARSGVSHSTISRMLSNGREPSLATLLRLGRGLGLSDLEIAQLLAAIPRPKRDGVPPQNPQERRLEYVLRADAGLGDDAVDQILALYRAVRSTGR